MSADWALALDEFERRILEQRAALDIGEAGDVPAFVPRPDLGAMPPELLSRAQALLAEAKDVEAELAGALAHVGQDLAMVRRLSASTGRAAGAQFLDTAL